MIESVEILQVSMLFYFTSVQGTDILLKLKYNI